MNRRKNHGALISGLRPSVEWNPSLEYIFLVITQEILRIRLLNLLWRLSIQGIESRVHLVGHVDQEPLKKLYKEAMLFVFPSKYEGFGFPCLEAMAFRTIMIASNV